MKLFPDHHLPGRRPGRGVVPIPDGQRHRPGLLHIQPGALPEGDRGDQVSVPEIIMEGTEAHDLRYRQGKGDPPVASTRSTTPTKPPFHPFAGI